MTFDEWAKNYFGDNVDVPEACRDAWQAATNAEREALRDEITEKAEEWDDRAEAFGMLLARDIVDARSNAKVTGSPALSASPRGLPGCATVEGENEC